ncbi:hypothetical protein VTJ49DRAFT_6545 [Mycothermus thermophilus]|uniref:Nephrocystin 3-like N-terminal domain-containing protein n=1 Tax=Humicola insolens TaxID=85995 RepID=A0ABR3VJ82_HUMIN
MEQKIRVHSFQEAKTYAALGQKVVENFSSQLGIGGDLETIESINADHRDMTKFSDKEDEGYRAVRGVLQTCIRTLPAQSRPSVAAPTEVDIVNSRMTEPEPILDENEQRQVQRFSSDYVTPLQDIPERHPGTCEWILRNKDFNSWIDGPSTALWISGPPGMGKTVIAKFLLEHFEKSTPSRKTVHFFFSDRDGTRRSPIAFLKAAIHQFIRHSARLFKEHVKPRIASFGDTVYESPALLWDIFFDMTQDPTLGPLVCVLDALDECDPKSWQDLIRRIGAHFSPSAESQGTKSSQQFKFVITSRPYDDINIHFSHFSVLRLQAENEDRRINQDITLFVENEVSRLAERRKYSPGLKTMVQGALIAGADGMFLWVHLMLEILSKTPVTRVSEQLRTLPQGIDPLYNRILDEIPKESMDTVKVILKWVVFAVRPLTLDELSMAVETFKH